MESDDFVKLEYHADATAVELSGGPPQWYVTCTVPDASHTKPVLLEALQNDLSGEELKRPVAIIELIEARLHALAYEPKREDPPTPFVVAKWTVNEG
jgi:hypothetical protein